MEKEYFKNKAKYIVHSILLCVEMKEDTSIKRSTNRFPKAIKQSAICKLVFKEYLTLL